MALAAGRIAVRMGLLDYDMDALEKWVGETLLSNHALQRQGQQAEPCIHTG